MFCGARDLIFNSNSTGAKGPFLWPPKSWECDSFILFYSMDITCHALCGLLRLTGCGVRSGWFFFVAEIDQVLRVMDKEITSYLHGEMGSYG